MKKIKQIMLIVFLLGFSTQAIAANDLGITTLDSATLTDTPKDKVEVVSAVKNGNEMVQQKWWENLVYNIINTILYIFGSVLSALLFWLLRKIGLKVNLQTLDDIAAKAALYAEKRSAEWLNQTGKKLPGATKMQWAWQLVETIDSKLTASDKARAKLRKIILAKVAAAEEQVAIAEAAKLNLEDQKKINKEVEALK